MHQGEATPELGEKYAMEVKKIIDQAHNNGKKVNLQVHNVLNLYKWSLSSSLKSFSVIYCSTKGCIPVSLFTPGLCSSFCLFFYTFLLLSGSINLFSFKKRRIDLIKKKLAVHMYLGLIFLLSPNSKIIIILQTGHWCPGVKALK